MPPILPPEISSAKDKDSCGKSHTLRLCHGIGAILNDSPNRHPTQFSQGIVFYRSSIALHMEAENTGALRSSSIPKTTQYVYHDEDVVIYINGVLAGSASGYTTAYVQLAMNPQAQAAIIPNGTNVLAVSCHQTTGGQFIDVGIDVTTVVVPPPPIFVPNWTENGNGLTAEYFAGTNLANLVLVRTDTNVDFSWNGTFARGRLSSNQFSVRWTGMIQPRYTEGYTFHLTTSDGCRLWVNGQLLIDKWHDDLNTDATGQHRAHRRPTIQREHYYYDNTNPADAVFEWDSASQTRQVVPAGRVVCRQYAADAGADSQRHPHRRTNPARDQQRH